MVANSLGAAGVTKKKAVQGPAAPKQGSHVRAILDLAKGGQLSPTPGAAAPAGAVPKTLPDPRGGRFDPNAMFDLNKNPLDTVPPEFAGASGPVKMRLDLPVSGVSVIADFPKAPTLQEIADAGDKIDANIALENDIIHPIIADQVSALPFDPVELYSASVSRKSWVKKKGGDSVMSKQQAQQQLAKILRINDYRQLNNLQGPEFKKLRLLVPSLGSIPDTQEANMRDAGLNEGEKGVIRRNPGIGLDSGLDTTMRFANTVLNPSEMISLAAGDPRTQEQIQQSNVNVLGMNVNEGAARAVFDVGANILAAMATGGASAAGDAGMLAVARSGLAGSAARLGAMGLVDAAGQVAGKSLARHAVEKAMLNAGINVAQTIPGALTGARDVQATTGKKYGQALRDSVQQQFEGLVRQFDPSTIFDESIPMGERVGAALNLAFLGAGAMGKGHDMASGLFKSDISKHWNEARRSPEEARVLAHDVVASVRQAEEAAAGRVTPESQALKQLETHLADPASLADVESAAQKAHLKASGILPDKPLPPDPVPSIDAMMAKMSSDEPSAPAFKQIEPYTPQSAALEDAIMNRREAFDPSSPEYNQRLVESAFMHIEGRKPETPEELKGFVADIEDIRKSLDETRRRAEWQSEETEPVRHMREQVLEMLGRERDAKGNRIATAAGQSLVPIRKGKDGYWKGEGRAENFYSLQEASPEVRSAIMSFADQWGDTEASYVTPAKFAEWKAAGKPNNMDGFRPLKASEVMHREGEGREYVRGRVLSKFAEHLGAQLRNADFLRRQLNQKFSESDLNKAVEHYLGKGESIPKVNKQTRQTGEVLQPERTRQTPKTHIGKIVAANTEEVKRPDGREFDISQPVTPKTHVQKLLAKQYESNQRQPVAEGRTVERIVRPGNDKNGDTSRNLYTVEDLQGNMTTKHVSGAALEMIEAVRKDHMLRLNKLKRTRFSDEAGENALLRHKAEVQELTSFHQKMSEALEMEGAVPYEEWLVGQSKSGSEQAKFAAQVRKLASGDEPDAPTSSDPYDYGTQNILVNSDKMAEIRARQAAKKKSLGNNRQRGAANIDPQDLADLIATGVYHFETTIRRNLAEFKKWKAAILADFADPEQANSYMNVLWHYVQHNDAKADLSDGSVESMEKLTNNATIEADPKVWEAFSTAITSAPSKMQEAKNRLTVLLFDDAHALEQVKKMYSEASGRPLTEIENTALDARQSWDNYGGTQSIIRMFIQYGPVDQNGVRLKDTNGDVIASLDELDSYLDSVDPKFATAWDKYRSALSENERNARKEPGSPHYRTPEQVKKNEDYILNFVREWGEDAVSKADKMWEQISDFQLVMYEMFDLRPPGWAEQIREKNPNYWPRVELPTKTQKRRGHIAQMIKGVGVNDQMLPAVSREREKVPGRLQMRKNYEHVLKEGRKNHALSWLEEYASEPLLEGLVQVASEDDIMQYRADPANYPVVERKRLGISQFYLVDPMIHAAFKSYDPIIFADVLGVAQQWVKGFATAFRRGTTSGNLWFKYVRNRILDLFSATQNHGLNPKFIKPGVAEAKKDFDSALVRQFIMAGGGQDGAAMQMFEGHVEMFGETTKYGNFKKQAGEKLGVRELSRQVWEKMEDIGSWTEISTRLAMYQQAIDAGMTPRAAAQAAVNMMNFRKKGVIPKFAQAIGAAYPAVRFQSWEQAYRGFKNDPAKYALRMTLMAAIPAIAQELIYKDDEDYKNLPEWQKDRGYLIKMPGNNGFFSIDIDPATAMFAWGLPRRVAQMSFGELSGMQFGKQIGEKLGAEAVVPFAPHIGKIGMESAWFLGSGQTIDLGFSRQLSGGDKFGMKDELTDAEQSKRERNYFRFVKQQMGNLMGSQGRNSAAWAAYLLGNTGKLEGEQETPPWPWQRYQAVPREERKSSKQTNAGSPTIRGLLESIKPPDPDSEIKKLLKDLSPSK